MWFVEHFKFSEHLDVNKKKGPQRVNVAKTVYESYKQTHYQNLFYNGLSKLKQSSTKY